MSAEKFSAACSDKDWKKRMSRIGKKPIPLPNGVSAAVKDGTVSVKGPKGELKLKLVPEIAAEVTADGVALTRRVESDRASAMWGMQRSLVNNLVLGVTQGFTEKLEISGVGYRAAVQGQKLNLQVGLSHEVNHPIPPGIQIVCEKPTMIQITGIDKQLVGQVAAEIRSYRPPEPYKGKGVRYASERIRRKEGKKK
jgi:large subunit ribosomal protein L6